MPAMTYCMFENTETELAQVVDAMSGAKSLSDLDLTEQEIMAFKRMWSLSRQFLAEHERLLNSVE